MAETRIPSVVVQGDLAEISAQPLAYDPKDWRFAMAGMEAHGVLTELTKVSEAVGAGHPVVVLESGIATAALMLADEALRGRAKAAALADLAAACRPRLGAAALRRLSDTAEAEREVGSGQLAADIELLLEWHKAAGAALAKMEGRTNG